jgi:uncharacterized protein
MERKITYFEDMGSQNTEATFELVKERLELSKVQKLVIASTSGQTARKALGFFDGMGVQLIIIPHQFGFRKENRFPQELVKELHEAGHRVHFGTMLFHTDGLYASNTPTLIANVLRCFSQGVKVCFEIVMMAADAGLLAEGETVIAIAGTGGGSDTAMLMRAASSQHMRKIRVHEIICKPSNPISWEEIIETAKQEEAQGE